MQGGTALPLQHGRHGALPAARLRGGGDLGQHGVADPDRRGNPLDREDLRQPFRPRDAHLIVRGVVHDEGPAFDAPQQQRRPGHATRYRYGRQDLELAVIEQRTPAPQATKELQVGGPRGRAERGDGRRERGVPVRAHGVPVGIVVARFRPDAGRDQLPLDGR